MIVWVLYDISNDRARTKAAKVCKLAGLTRVQLSVFLGTTDKDRKDTLELQLEGLIDENLDKVYLFTMNRDQLRHSRLLGQAFDRRLINNEIRALFF